MTLVNCNSLMSREMVAWVTLMPSSSKCRIKSSWVSISYWLTIALMRPKRSSFVIRASLLLGLGHFVTPSMPDFLGTRLLLAAFLLGERSDIFGQEPFYQEGERGNRQHSDKDTVDAIG